MPGEPRLRALPDDEGRAASPASAGSSKGAGWIPVALGVAVALLLALLLWSRVQLGQQIAVLEDEVRSLRATVAARERVIAAHQQRLATVKLRIDEIGALLDEPLPGAE
jgi:hypothetical protein